MTLCLLIGSDAIAQQTDKQMPKITPVKPYNPNKITTMKKKPLKITEGASKSATSKSNKVVIHQVSAATQRKALETRLEHLENSDLTSKQKAIIREKIQTRLDNL